VVVAVIIMMILIITVVLILIKIMILASSIPVNPLVAATHALAPPPSRLSEEEEAGQFCERITGWPV
jgi:hypothetical protein